MSTTDVVRTDTCATNAESPNEKIDAIIAEEAAKAGISVADLLGRGRQRHVVRARYAAMKKVRRAFPDQSYPALGRVFRRHHATVMYALGALQRKPEA